MYSVFGNTLFSAGINPLACTPGSIHVYGPTSVPGNPTAFAPNLELSPIMLPKKSVPVSVFDPVGEICSKEKVWQT